jgi:Putative Actinobacterial Holin-X, holin superfamily III
MSVPGVDKAAQQSFGDMAQVMSEQAMVLVRQEVARARRELSAKAKDASSGAAMVGGAALLGTLAAGTGTAALVLLLARRPEPSAAALGVTGLYAGAGALLARQGLAHLRAAAPPIPEETVQSVKRDLGSKKKPARPPQSRPRSAANRTKKAARRADVRSR